MPSSIHSRKTPSINKIDFTKETKPANFSLTNLLSSFFKSIGDFFKSLLGSTSPKKFTKNHSVQKTSATASDKPSKVVARTLSLSPGEAESNPLDTKINIIFQLFYRGPDTTSQFDILFYGHFKKILIEISELPDDNPQKDLSLNLIVKKINEQACTSKRFNQKICELNLVNSKTAAKRGPEELKDALKRATKSLKSVKNLFANPKLPTVAKSPSSSSSSTTSITSRPSRPSSRKSVPNRTGSSSSSSTSATDRTKKQVNITKEEEKRKMIERMKKLNAFRPDQTPKY